MSTPDKPTIFISYSHFDEEWKDRLRPHLKLLEQAGLSIVVWDDRAIDGGAQWYNEIKQAMDRAAVAVCLISPHFLASDFCIKEEIPYLLERREHNGMALMPILVRHCLWQAFDWLKSTQMLPRDGKSVADDFRDSPDPVFMEVAKRIFDIINDPTYRPPTPPPPQWSPPEKIEISRLPVTGTELFGRQRELEMLDAAWASDDANVVSLVAWGGVGKSTLVNRWLERMAGDNYRGARRVYAWSFYSQGTGERVTSADQFINAALQWFGDTDPTAGSPWDKGERLARLVQAEKTLLLLDGLEPLQSPHAHERGKIKDPALLTLLTELARNNPGLCLITTREQMSDLAEFAATVQHKDLEQISDEAGRALLRVGGVQGTDAELEQATRAFGNHALAINLLAVYLRDVPGHHISHAATIPDLDIPEEDGRHPRRLMAAFAQRFGDGPEVELLRMLGLFDRPADKASLRALRRAPTIPGLTDHIRELTEAGWLRLLDKLRRTKLIAPQSQHRLDDLDAHPIVRQHFGEQLKQEHPEAWRAGNARLYEHLKRTTKVFPDTLEGMTPLYAAIAHGCEAGKHEEVLKNIYIQRIQRNVEHFSTIKLGAINANLIALSNFFAVCWSQPIDWLTEKAKSFVLGDAGFFLQALGYSKEAISPLLISLNADILIDDNDNAATSADQLGELFLTLGDLPQALYYAQLGVGFANRTNNRFHQTTTQSGLATVLHQQGRLLEAEAAFCKAEEIQKKRQPQFPILYSVSGFRYCSLLLDQGAYAKVQERCKRTMEWGEETESYGLIDFGLTYLSLGQAYLFQSLSESIDNHDQSLSCFKQAIEILRQSESKKYLALGLLSRAVMYRSIGIFVPAQNDLEQATSIITRSNMSLYQADCHLEYARLYLARGEGAQARASWGRAREMVERMGYHRRDRDVQEIDEQLTAAGM